MPKNLTLRQALASTTMTAVAVALTLACGAFVAYELVTFRATLVRGVSSRAAIVGQLSTSALVFEDPESATATLAVLGADSRIVSAAIYGADGKPFASYARDRGAVPAPAPLGVADGHEFRGDRLLLSHPISLDGRALGTIVLESDLTEMTTRLQRYALIVLVVLAASFALAYATASRLQRAISVPVVNLAQTAEVVSSRQDYAVRAPAGDAVGELELLVRTFNHMLDQIQERDAALQHARDHLERQVASRTFDLETEIAERRSLAEELERNNSELEAQSVRVQEATRMKSEFLANMSHELRTPLNAIIGFTELLHDERVGSVTADQKECLADVLTSSKHLLQLINDVLDLSKVEAGKMDFHPEPVDLGKVVGEVRDIVRAIAAKKRIVVTSELQPGLDEVVIDAGKLKQVLYNFISNALKFTPADGRVVVRVAPEGASDFRIEVEDSGIGIRPEDVPRLFVEFQQLDASASKAHAGTGLGLALTRRIVEAQGGRVGVRSRPGQGSLFFAVLPRVNSESTATASLSAPAPKDARAARILVVEDDSRDRAWLVETLSAAGYAVEEAVTGRAAIERCAAQRFDGITMDLFLSDMTGWDVLRDVRAQGTNQTTPVIVVSVVSQKGLGGGFAIHDHLTKPLSREDLLASLRRAGVDPSAAGSILVIDDDPQALKLMATTLESLGYAALSVASGQAGLVASQGNRIATVILDLGMPEMSGFEFLDLFRRHPEGRDVPVIVWTAKDLTREELARLSASAQGVVLKHAGGSQNLIDELRRHVAPAVPLASPPPRADSAPRGEP